MVAECTEKSCDEQGQHRSINNFLNRAVEDRKRGIKYERQNEIDYFYRQEGGASVRVTRDAGTMQVKEGGIVIKRRIADLNVICPNHDLDYRISINVEQPMSESVHCFQAVLKSVLLTSLSKKASCPWASQIATGRRTGCITPTSASASI